MSADAERLARIEMKLDDLASAVILLARVEERVSSMSLGHERQAERILVLENDRNSTQQRLFNLESNILQVQENSNRIRTLEDTSTTNGISIKFAERIFWIVVASGIGLFFTLFK